MSGGAGSLEARRAALVARAEAERAALAAEFAPFERPLQIADQGLAIVRRVKPLTPAIAIAVGLGVAALTLARARGAGSLVQGGLAAVKAGRSVRGLLSRL
jgi:hypothetical protein